MKPVIFFLNCMIALGVTAKGEKPKEIRSAGDPPYFERYEGSVLFRFAQKDYASYKLPLGPENAENAFDNELDLEGEVQKRTYAIPEGRSALEVFRNYKHELDATGWTTLWEGKGEALGFWFAKAWDDIGDGSSANQYFAFSPNAMLYWAGKIERGDGTYHASLVVTIVQLNTVRAGMMEKKMTVVNADKIQSDIRAEGRIAFYGIFFDFDKAELKSESEAQLAEMALFLKTHADTRVFVTGHTDNKGTLDYNLSLSDRRAKAVVTRLSSRYGISADRLVPRGLGQLAPLASNDTEAGRAKNRRVEMVQQ
jgi:outer membrane protein OmpA-like peptidoglycan-associated protein